MSIHTNKNKTDFLKMSLINADMKYKKKRQFVQLSLLSSFWDIFRLSVLLTNKTEHVKETATVILHRQCLAMAVVTVPFSYYVMTKEQGRLIIVSPTIMSKSWEVNWWWLCHLVPAFNLCSWFCGDIQL